MQLVETFIRLAKEAQKDIEAGRIRRVKKLLNVIEKIELAEIVKLKDISVKLQNRCREIFDLTKEAEKEIINTPEVTKIINRIIKLEEILQREILEKTADLERYELGKCIGVGGNSHVYEIKQDPGLVMIVLGSTGFGKFTTKTLREVNREIDMFKTIPKCVNAPKTLRTGRIGKYNAVLMERAWGKPLHDRKGGYPAWKKNLKRLAEAPQRHYNKYWRDYRIINTRGFVLDPSKPDNIMYDEEKGFFLIDLHLDKKRAVMYSLDIQFCYTYVYYNSISEGLVTENDFDNIKIILTKLKKAGDPCSHADEILRSWDNREERRLAELRYQERLKQRRKKSFEVDVW